jgi:hypothetical protein
MASRTKEEMEKKIDQKEKEIEDDGRRNSEILSERVRSISLAIMGLSWTFILANLTSNTQSGSGLISTGKLLIPILISAIALLCDFVQYTFNQYAIDSRLKEFPNLELLNDDKLREQYEKLILNEDKPDKSKDSESKAQSVFQWKVGFTIASVVSFIFIMFPAIFT